MVWAGIRDDGGMGRNNDTEDRENSMDSYDMWLIDPTPLENGLYRSFKQRN